MKITDEISISLDKINSIRLNKSKDDGVELTIYDDTSTDVSYWIFFDQLEGEGFCKNLKAKIDAYLEAKEKFVMCQAVKGHHDVEKYLKEN